MARNLDLIVRDTLGNQAWQIVQLAAELEATQEKLAELEKVLRVVQAVKTDAPTPDPGPGQVGPVPEKPKVVPFKSK